ncbi:hypothetical protein V6N12_016111 [Hibiscus sabdariffa]|uniref:Uncharacterized protein n=1 Tax=Hibiscus sabdariffa TaxID=183260 RepID=A0ABR2C8S4_9ROSI
MNGDVGFENINPPAMECLNTLIMRKKQSSKSRAPESNLQVVLRPKHHLQLNDFLQNHQRRYLCHLYPTSTRIQQILLFLRINLEEQSDLLIAIFTNLKEEHQQLLNPSLEVKGMLMSCVT